MNEIAGQVRVREASFEDYNQVASLAHQYGLGTKGYSEWKHLWGDNLFYRQAQEDWPIGWVLENKDRRIVGYIGNIPLGFEFQGQQLIAAGTYSWVVDSPYRSYSMLLLERYFDQKKADLYLSTTVNSQASKAFRVFDSPPVPVGTWNQSAFWITNYQGFAASWLAMKGSRSDSLIRLPLSVGLLLRDVVARKAFAGYRNEENVEFCAGFDDRFDTFWEALKKKNSHMLLGVRTREALEWHFKPAILKNEAWVLTIANGSGLLAYSIFRRQDNPKFGLRRMRLADIQVLNENPARLVAMLSCALKRCRAEGIHMLEYVGFSPRQVAIFENLKAHRRQLPSWSYFYKARDQRLALSLENPNVWNPSCFDGDSSL